MFSRLVLPGKYEVYNGKQFAFHWQPRLKTGHGSLTRGLTSSPTWLDLLCLNSLHSELGAFSFSWVWFEALPGRRQNQSCVHSFLGKPNFLTTSEGIPWTRTMFLVDAISPAMASYSGLSSSARPGLLLFPSWCNYYHSSTAEHVSHCTSAPPQLVR